MAFSMQDDEFDSHESARHRVCVLCYRKGSRKLSPNDISFISDNIIQDYSPNNPDFPAAICNGCYLLLSKKRNGQEVRLPEVDSYDPRRQMTLRSKACECRICEIAHAELQAAVKLKKKPGRPVVVKDTIKAESFKICSNCFSKIYRGCSHSKQVCSSRRSKVYHLENLIDSDSTTKERLASRTIASSENGLLSTLGRSPRYMPQSASSPKNRPTISFSDMSSISQDLNLSARQTYRLGRDLRKAAGYRLVVEPNLKPNLEHLHQRLNDFFELRNPSYTGIGKENRSFTQQTVICNNLQLFIHEIVSVREVDLNSSLIKIGIDGGGGFLKVSLAIHNDSAETSDDKVLSKSFKTSGVKKLFIIGLVPDVPENYWNLKSLWLLIGIHKLTIDFTIASDMKICNILLGLMAHGSLHPCSWCDVEKGNLHSCGNQRTIGSLKQLFWNYYDSGADTRKAKEFGNVVHASLLHGGDDTPIIAKVPPPELHLLIGPVCTLFKHMQNVWPAAKSWLEACHVERQMYHGGTFTGNTCITLLNNLHLLHTLSPPSCCKFVETFRCFKRVVDSCYGKDLHAQYHARIQDFKNSYLHLGIPVTPKIHAVMYHVHEFCELKDTGLGPFSEQSVESLHQDFQNAWEKVSVSSTSNPRYGERLLKAVQMYNSRHM